MTMVDNPRAVIGDNRAPDFATRISEELRQQYAETERRVADIVGRAEQALEITDDETMGVAAKIIKDADDEDRRLEKLREAEKMPYYRAGQIIDNFFKSLKLKLRAQSRADKPGTLDILRLNLNAYNHRKLVAEQERRRLEQAERDREAREARLREEAARRVAEEARLKADRARKDIADKQAAAAGAEVAAHAARAAEKAAADAAEEARIATLAKPADMVRTRVAEGPIVTMAREFYAVIDDYDALNRDAIWPFLKPEHIDQAFRQLARTRNYSPGEWSRGASVGAREKTVLK